MADTLSESNPSVGIFWYMSNRLLVNDIKINSSDAFASHADQALCHNEYWEELKNIGRVPKNLEFDDPPRGRVTYNQEEDKFYILIDRCIKKPAITENIAAAFKLPAEKWVVKSDARYLCRLCRKDGSIDFW